MHSCCEVMQLLCCVVLPVHIGLFRTGHHGTLIAMHFCCCFVPAAAELNKLTTEDVEEERWLAQQRQAQALHDYYEARAAQGRLLRGRLGSSLRSSMNKLWSEDQRQLASSGSRGCWRQDHQEGNSWPQRPGSAPAQRATASAPCKSGQAVDDMPPVTANSTPAADKAAGSSGTAGRQKLNSSRHQSTNIATVPKAAAHMGTRAHKAQPKGNCRPASPDPWAPVVVSFQISQHTNIETSSNSSTGLWQHPQQQLLTVCLDQEVMHELAGVSHQTGRQNHW
jgi:hypothetical protein